MTNSFGRYWEFDKIAEMIFGAALVCIPLYFLSTVVILWTAYLYHLHSLYVYSFSAFTLLVGRQEGHPACKKSCTSSTKGFYLETFRGPGLNWSDLWRNRQTCSQDRQCQDQDQQCQNQDQDRSVRDQDQDRKWQHETKCTQFTQQLLLSKTSKTLIDVKFTTEYCI